MTDIPGFITINSGPDSIIINKEKLMNVWACLVLALNDDHYTQEAYHQLYTAWNDREDANPFDAFSEWWTHNEADAALKRMRDLTSES